jgi:hypothetical protein
MITDPDDTDFAAADLAERVHHGQGGLRTVPRAQYDLIVCGSGFSWTSRRPVGCESKPFKRKQSRQRRQLYTGSTRSRRYQHCRQCISLAKEGI